MNSTSIDLTIEELMLLHKQGNQKATIFLLDLFEGLMNKYSRISKFSKEINPDIKNALIIICLNALNTFDISNYIE